MWEEIARSFIKKTMHFIVINYAQSTLTRNHSRVCWLLNLKRIANRLSSLLVVSHIKKGVVKHNDFGQTRINRIPN